MIESINGKCYVCGDSVTVYQIVPEKHWTMKQFDPEEMGQWIFEEQSPEFAGRRGAFISEGYSIVVAGKNFGCGSKSVEHPIAALKSAGIKAIIAESASRYSYRNAINLALPLLICPGITNKVQKGDQMEIQMDTGIIENLSAGNCYQAEKIGSFAMKIIKTGGLMNYIRESVAEHDM